MFDVLTEGRFEAKVSSVLNRQVKEYGKTFVFDGREDTCWNSDQGTPQWISVRFEDGEPREISELRIMFQGGFAGKTCWIEAGERRQDVHPEDVNKLQSFPISPPIEAAAVKVVFADSTDFFGRVTVYQMKLMSK